MQSEQVEQLNIQHALQNHPRPSFLMIIIMIDKAVINAVQPIVYAFDCDAKPMTRYMTLSNVRNDRKN